MMLKFVISLMFSARKRSTILATISRSQSKAHDYIQRDIVATFYQELKNSNAFEMAWFQSCLVARSKSPLCRCICLGNAFGKRIQIRLPVCLQIWPKDENECRKSTMQMSICAFAFVVTKVTISIRDVLCGSLELLEKLAFRIKPLEHLKFCILTTHCEDVHYVPEKILRENLPQKRSQAHSFSLIVTDLSQELIADLVEY
eukprot:IDg23340t1